MQPLPVDYERVVELLTGRFFKRKPPFFSVTVELDGGSYYKI